VPPRPLDRGKAVPMRWIYLVVKIPVAAATIMFELQNLEIVHHVLSRI
jgi:hypothetical protein